MLFGEIDKLVQIGAIKDKNYRCLEVPLENDGRIVVYSPAEGVQILACDIRRDAKYELERLILNNLFRGSFFRITICCSGKCAINHDSKSAVLAPNEVAAEYCVDYDTLSVVSESFSGLIIELYLDKMSKEGSLYSIFRSRLKNIGFFEEKTDPLLSFRQSNMTRREVDNLMRMSFSCTDDAMILIKTAELGLRFCDDISISKSEHRWPVNKSQLEIAKEIKMCLSERYYERWTIKYFADKFNLSSTTLNKYFMSVYGYEIKEYQIKVRMERAQEMLCKTDYSVGEIAQRVGYTTHAKFGAMFKDKYGVPPLEYRHRYRFSHSNTSDTESNQ